MPRSRATRWFSSTTTSGSPSARPRPRRPRAPRRRPAQLRRDRAAGASLAKKADEGTLALDDLRGGSFTITNGASRLPLSTPILNPPQVGILGLHKIADRPVAVDGRVEVRPMMYLALTYDHRIVDGPRAVQALVTVAARIEDPGALLIEA
ncbi:MAG: 2-oxo acid dehydrogenase subunit E2 [Vicinamibacterales bacterium]